MDQEQRIISEGDLGSKDLEPSETFARLIGRVGDKAALGTLGLSAIKQIVQERAKTDQA